MRYLPFMSEQITGVTPDKVELRIGPENDTPHLRHVYGPGSWLFTRLDGVTPFVPTTDPTHLAIKLEALETLAQRWRDYEGKPSNPGDVEDEAFANGTEWGMRMAAHQLRELIAPQTIPGTEYETAQAVFGELQRVLRDHPDDVEAHTKFLHDVADGNIPARAQAIRDRLAETRDR